MKNTKNDIAFENNLLYLNEIKSIPLLTREEELELAKRASEGDKKARELLICANLHLVVNIAKSYNSHSLSFQDLVQEGNLGLIKAIDKFDYRLEYRISTYASWWIRQMITKAINEQSRSIRIPSHMTMMIRKYQKIVNAYILKLGREPSFQELAEELNIPQTKILEIQDLLKDIISLDVPLNNEDGVTWLECIPDKSNTREDDAMIELLRLHIEEAFSTLTDRESQIVRMRYGLDENAPCTLEEIGKHLGITRERVRQILYKALQKLKEYEHFFLY